MAGVVPAVEFEAAAVLPLVEAVEAPWLAAEAVFDSALGAPAVLEVVSAGAGGGGAIMGASGGGEAGGGGVASAVPEGALLSVGAAIAVVLPVEGVADRGWVDAVLTAFFAGRGAAGT
jgi:hypothetical protein